MLNSSALNTSAHPVIFAALGMAAAYYGYPRFTAVGGLPVLFGALLAFTAAIAFFRTIRFYPAVSGSNKPYHGTVPKRGGFSACSDLSARIGILLVAAAVGFALGIASRQSVAGAAHTGISGERVRAVSGILREDPRALQSGAGLGTLELRGCSGSGALRASASGRLAVFFPTDAIPRLREFGRGSEIYVDGTLSQGVRGQVFRATSVHIVKPAPPLEQFRTGFRLALLDTFSANRAQPRSGAPVWGALASALLLGVRDDLNTEFSAAFFNSGTSYILALSGMHLAVISGILAFFIRRPLGVRLASLFGAVFIILYVFLAGPQPSLVRAAIMYIIGTFAVWSLLKKHVLSILSMAFIIQLTAQSETGLSLSFMLSYAALAGMVTLGGAFHSIFQGRMPEVLGKGLAASLGAFIATAPLVVFYFGSLRPIGIIAGLAAAFLCTLFMAAALAVLVASSAPLPLPLWNVFDGALTLLYRAIELTVSLAARVPPLPFSQPVPVLIVSAALWLAVLAIKKRDDTYRNNCAAFA